MKKITCECNKILCITGHFPPCAASGVFRALGFVRHLERSGWQVAVLAMENIEEEREDSCLLQQIPGSVHVERTGYLDVFKLRSAVKARNRSEVADVQSTGTVMQDSNPEVKQGLKETLTYLLKTPDSYVGWLIPGIFRALTSIKRPDIIFATAPPFSSLMLGVLLKKIWRKPLVVDLRDPWVQNPLRSERPFWADQWDKTLERWVMRNADQVIMNTQEASALYQGLYGGIKEKFTAIYNGFDNRFLEFNSESRPEHIDIWIVHVGSLYGNRNPEALIQGVTGLHQFQIDLYGPGAEQYKDHNTPANIRFHPSVKHEQAISLQKGADVTLILGNNTPGSVQVPAKIFEVLAVSKTIWLIDSLDSPTRQMLLEHNIAHIFCENSSKEIQKVALALIEMKKNQTLPLLNDTTTNIFDRKIQAEKLNDILQTQLEN